MDAADAGFHALPIDRDAMVERQAKAARQPRVGDKACGSDQHVADQRTLPFRAFQHDVDRAGGASGAACGM
jgi:hypothetical protein